MVKGDVYLSKEKYFSNKEYLLGELAFAASSVMVLAFQKGHTYNLSEVMKYLKTKLAKVQIKSENSIELLKVKISKLTGPLTSYLNQA